jgi:8-oxo-dGTP diphosphatase
MTTIQKIALAVFKNKKVMMLRSARNNEVFYTLGGKVEPAEADIDCIKREVKEEINCEIDSKSITFLHEFQAPAHGKENVMLHLRLYKGTIIGEPSPTNEIAQIEYFDSSVNPKHLTQTGKEIFQWLKEKEYID